MGSEFADSSDNSDKTDTMKSITSENDREHTRNESLKAVPISTDKYPLSLSLLSEPASHHSQMCFLKYAAMFLSSRVLKTCSARACPIVLCVLKFDSVLLLFSKILNSEVIWNLDSCIFHFVNRIQHKILCRLTLIMMDFWKIENSESSGVIWIQNSEIFQNPRFISIN